MTGAPLAVDLLDPRTDPVPPYWPALLARAGLPACWSYDLLRTASWSRRSPVLLAVLRRGPAGPAGTGVVGLVCATWGRLAAAGNRFAAPGTGRGPGVLEVRLPGASALPGWWFAGPAGARPELLAAYRRAGYAALGPRCRGVVWRQIAPAEVPDFRGRPRLLLRTPPVAELPLPGPSETDWLAGLASSRRRDLRRQARLVAADPDLVVRFGAGRSDVDAAALVGVLRWNEARYRGRYGRQPPAPGSYLAALVARPDVRLLSYQDHTGRLLAFAAVLDHASEPIVTYGATLPVGAGGRPHLYFDFYGRIVAWAAAAGKQAVIFGKGQAAVKQSLGCRLRPQHAVLLPRLV